MLRQEQSISIKIIRAVNNLNLKLFLKIFLLGPASAGSYKMGVVGNNWLVGNAVISETAPWIFLIFCMKLGDQKSRKVTEPDF